MAYITLIELAEKTKQSKRTLERKIAFLKEYNLSVYLRYTKRNEKGKGVTFDEQFLVPYFMRIENFKGYQSKQNIENQKYNKRVEGIEPGIYDRIKDLEEELSIFQFNKEQQDIFNTLKTQKDKDRFSLVVLVCSKYSESKKGIKEVCSENVVSYKSFMDWCKQYAYLSTIYKAATRKHKKYIKKMNVLTAEESLSMLIDKSETVDKKLRQVINKDGEIKTLQEINTRQHLPSLSAIQYVLNNHASKHYKDKQPIDTQPKLTEQEEGEQILAQMTKQEQIDAMKEYILEMEKEIKEEGDKNQD